jgi:hypothetical protein
VWVWEARCHWVLSDDDIGPMARSDIGTAGQPAPPLNFGVLHSIRSLARRLQLALAMIVADLMLWCLAGVVVSRMTRPDASASMALACVLAAVSVGWAVRLESVVGGDRIHIASILAATVAAALLAMAARIMSDDIEDYEV